MTSSPLKVGLKTAVDVFPGAFQKIAINNNSGGKMEISFHRTVRVPDDGKNYQLPPDLGKFPTYSIDDYAEKLPLDIVREGGVFVPIWQREALWIKFHAYETSRLAVKVFVGGINAMSEESRHFIQLVAVPTGSGYSVEAQIKGFDKIAGLRFEIIPFRVLFHFDGKIIIKTLTSKSFPVHVSSDMTVATLKDRIQGKESIPIDQQRLIFMGKILEEHHTLGDISVEEGMTVYLLLRVCGGFGFSNLSSWEKEQMQNKMMREFEPMKKEFYDRHHELTLTPGGSIHQAIRKDCFHRDRYDERNAVMFNMQLLSPKTFHLVTGTPPPQTPISAGTYARHGYPFFEIYNERRAFTGTFEGIPKPVGDIDKEKNVNLEVHQQENGLHFRSVKLNTVDEMSQFYTEMALPNKNGQN
ncbi:uncharacterized protein EAF02_011194 [Botrytis sinoallii]|uniref:uncharacterized protein n=1 Tax=Botrytis sinoallii TaxID=1463999 RepID=UPI00190087BB|nr:uncharacterized protein EAF02_011194 [Botrytis sinoallii]KAF7857827.1 hypothetical protein EAF02_011194 [Botrytis sinoallii]